jgi:hypothetical protein
VRRNSANVYGFLTSTLSRYKGNIVGVAVELVMKHCGNDIQATIDRLKAESAKQVRPMIQMKLLDTDAYRTAGKRIWPV